MRVRGLIEVVAVTWLVAVGPMTGDATAATPAPIDLGAADSFAVLGATTVTSAGQSTITGDLGVSPGTAITGFPPGTIAQGGLHAGDTAAAEAHTGLVSAYGVAVGRTATPSSGDLGGVTLTSGVYGWGAGLALTGTLTLDGQGDPGAVFILRAGSTLDTAAGSAVSLTGGAQACNVFWQVGSTASLGASSAFSGTILAATSITSAGGSVVNGRLLARDGAVTLTDDTVSAAYCAAGELSTTAPAIKPFSATLTGVNQTIHVALGAWSVSDARGSGAGYSVTATASAPTVDGSVAKAGTGATVTLMPTTATAAAGNAATAPVAASGQKLGETAVWIQNAPAGSGQGTWEFAADFEAVKKLHVVIPADAAAGAFSSTLTFTTAAPVAP